MPRLSSLTYPPDKFRLARLFNFQRHASPAESFRYAISAVRNKSSFPCSAFVRKDPTFRTVNQPRLRFALACLTHDEIHCRKLETSQGMLRARNVNTCCVERNICLPLTPLGDFAGPCSASKIPLRDRARFRPFLPGRWRAGRSTIGPRTCSPDSVLRSLPRFRRHAR